MAGNMSDLFSAGGDPGVSYANNLTTLKACFSAADGGTGGSTANEIRLTADISGINVNLEFRNVHRLSAIGGMKTLTWDGTHVPKFTFYSSSGQVGTITWSRSTVTGSGTSFLTAVPMTAGRRYFLSPLTGNNPDVDIVSVTNDTSLETGQHLESYVASGGGIGWAMNATGSGYYYADVCFDLNYYKDAHIYWSLSDAIFERCVIKNFNNFASSPGAYTFFLRYCSNIEFRSCLIFNMASTGDYNSPLCLYHCHNVTYTCGTTLQRLRGYNSSGGVIAGLAHSYCTDIGFIGAKVMDVYNSYDTNNGTYGLWDGATSYYSYYLGVNILGVKLKSGRTGSRSILSQGANCLIVGCLFKGCDNNVASYAGTTTYIGNEDT